MSGPVKAILVALLCFGTAIASDLPKNLATSILSENVAQDVLGVEVEGDGGNGQADSENARTLISHCAYHAKDAHSTPAHFDLLIRRFQSDDIAKEQFDGAAAVYHGASVAGFRDAAFRSPLPFQLHVRKGKVWISVTAGIFKPDPTLERKLAEEVLRHLPD